MFRYSGSIPIRENEKLAIFFQSFGEAYISSLSVHLNFETWYEVEIWTSSIPC